MKIDRGLVTVGSTQAVLAHLGRAMTGRLELEENIWCRIVTVPNTGSANTEFTVTHALGRTPVVYFWNIDRSGLVYDSQRNLWDTTTLRLKCSVANAAVVVVIF